jgi:uncharacterized damage-inducible protein DinB
MTEIERLAAAIERTVAGPVWHGLALADLLESTSEDDAAARPIEDAHTIWELVLHLTAWAHIVERRLAMVPVPEATDAEDWPPAPDPTEQAWQHAMRQLTASHVALARAVRALDPALLDVRVPSRDYPLREMLHGVVEHGAYHGGQIALLIRGL